MLRVYRKPNGQRFEFRSIDRSHCAKIIGSLMSTMREFVEPGDIKDARTADPNNRSPLQSYAESRLIPPSEFMIEWQDGNGMWDESKPVETIRVE